MVNAGSDEHAAGGRAPLLLADLEQRGAAGPVDADREQRQGAERGAADEEDEGEDDEDSGRDWGWCRR